MRRPPGRGLAPASTPVAWSLGHLGARVAMLFTTDEAHEVLVHPHGSRQGQGLPADSWLRESSSGARTRSPGSASTRASNIE